MPVVDAAAITQRIVVLEAAVAHGKAKEAVHDRRIEGLEAANARLSIEVATLRPAAAAARTAARRSSSAVSWRR